MARSTGIVLSGTMISFSNEWVHTNKPNMRILVAGGALALLFDGIEHVNEQAGVGLSILFLITVLITPIQGDSPVMTLANWSGASTKRKFDSGGGNFNGGRTF